MMATGVFVGNWLIIPTLMKITPYKRSYCEGFAIGVIASFLCLMAGILLKS